MMPKIDTVPTRTSFALAEMEQKLHVVHTALIWKLGKVDPQGAALTHLRGATYARLTERTMPDDAEALLLYAVRDAYLDAVFTLANLVSAEYEQQKAEIARVSAIHCC